MPDLVIADQLYATHKNPSFLLEHHIDHAFKPLGRPKQDLDPSIKRRRRKRQRQRNAIEGLFGTLKNNFNLDRIVWTIPDGADMQIRLGLIANNLHKALASN